MTLEQRQAEMKKRQEKETRLGRPPGSRDGSMDLEMARWLFFAYMLVLKGWGPGRICAEVGRRHGWRWTVPEFEAWQEAGYPLQWDGV